MSTRPTMLPLLQGRLPLSFALDLDAGAVDQQVQGLLRPPERVVDLQGLLAVAQRAEARHRPFQVDQLQQALGEASCLAQCYAEQHLHRQTGLDRGIAIVGLTPTLAGWRGLLDHGGFKPDCQRAAVHKRCVIVRRVPGLVGGGCRSAQAVQLPCWIREMNPSRDLCNKAFSTAPLPLPAVGLPPLTRRLSKRM